MPVIKLDDEAQETLIAYHWPGNVRELENTLNRASILATADVLLPKDIPLNSAAMTAESGGILADRRITELLHILFNCAGETPLLPWLEKHAANMILEENNNDEEATDSKLGITRERLKELLGD